MQAKAALLIAGVGASAGGLEAMLPMFARMRATGRMSFVVAQHMAKDGHDELVVRLMNRESSLPVVLAANDEKLVADRVYVIPSGKDGVVRRGRLTLQDPAPHHISTPSVNALFQSLAAESHAGAIGIVLSGTGYDGTVGCRAIKDQGGLTIAQRPEEAKFDGMPVAAIEAQVVDEVLSVAAIGELLASRCSESRDAGLGRAPVPPASTLDAASLGPLPAMVSPPPGELAQLLALIHQETGIDFSSYKEDTLLRRLNKRLSMLGMKTTAEYLVHVRKFPDELNVIQHLFLVSVSSFFRDAESFQVLKMSLARLVAGKPAGELIRVWVPGCASGEETYTLAILFKELTDKHPIEIIGTDLNPDALAIARSGIYRQTAFKEMPPSLQERYTASRGQHAEIASVIRGCVRLEQRDVLSGPPMEGLDLVSCRNLLIYMKSELQDQLITDFHRALRPFGLLFIGQSESLSFVGNSLFMPIDHYHRLFRRRH